MLEEEQACGLALSWCRLGMSPCWGIRREYLDFIVLKLNESLFASYDLEYEVDDFHACLSSMCGNLGIDGSGAGVS